MKEEIVPPGTKAFPVVSSSHTKHSEPIRGVGQEAVSHPVRPSGVPDKEERRGAATLTPHNTPVSLLSATEDVTRTFVPGEDKSRDQRKVNMERPRGLEQDPAAPGSHGQVSNDQSKVTDPIGKCKIFSLSLDLEFQLNSLVSVSLSQLLEKLEQQRLSQLLED